MTAFAEVIVAHNLNLAKFVLEKAFSGTEDEEVRDGLSDLLLDLNDVKIEHAHNCDIEDFE